MKADLHTYYYDGDVQYVQYDCGKHTFLDQNGLPVKKITKKEKKPTGELSKFVSTPDDWHPNISGTFASGLVQVRLLSLGPKSGGKWRVLVKGGDDYGKEKDFPNRDAALPVYNMIKDGIRQLDLEDEGFDPH